MRYSAVVIFALFCSLQAQADWQLNNEESSLHFVSVKASHVAEVHRFTELEGSATQASAEVTIQLASVATGIDIRNERMRKYLFKTDLLPTATVTADLTKLALKKLKRARRQAAQLPVTLLLNNVTAEMTAEVSIVRLSKNRYLIQSIQPLVVNANGFKLGAGIEKLKELASLPSIGHAVPVSFSLMFEPVRN